MAIRKVMTTYFTTYFPEPNFIWLVKDKIQASQFSFIGKGKVDHKLEALRLMQNAFKNDLSDPNQTTFGICGAVTTPIPERMKTQESKKNKFNIAEKPTLQGLRSRKAQLHSFPRVWANQLYPFLTISASTTTNITTPLMDLYGVFHPTSLIFAWKGQLIVNYKSEYFHKIMGFYQDYVKCMRAIYNDTTKRNMLIQNFCNVHGKNTDDKKQLETFLKFQIDEMFKAKASLKKIYDATPTSDPSELGKIVYTAINSGRAIYLKFKKYS